MSCSLANLQGIIRECSNVGGLKNIWLNNIKNVTYDNNLTEDLQPVGIITFESGSVFLMGDFENYKNYDLVNFHFVSSEGMTFNYVYRIHKIDIYQISIFLTGPAYTAIMEGPPSDTNVKKILGICNFTVSSTFKKYSFRKGNASFKIDISKDDKNGTAYSNTQISLQFNKMESEKRKEIGNIVKSNCYAIILDNNGIYWFVGDLSYVSVSSVNGQTGSVLSEGNFYTLNLASDTILPPYVLEFAGEIISNILQ